MAAHRVPGAQLALLALSLGFLTGCGDDRESDCIGTPAPTGEWAVFEGELGEGAPCTTPAGDLEVRYDQRSSDELVATWSELVPRALGAQLHRDWSGASDYRVAWYEAGGRVLNVSIVPRSGSRFRTVRLTWERP